ncbi:MAG: ABC transporter permease [Ferruginibacter sp.]
MEGTQAYAKENADKEGRAEIHINKYHVDYDYLKTLGMQMKAGRYFSRDFNDSSAVVLNEAAVKEFGISGDPVGKSIVTSGQHEFNIIGIVKDFHYTSVKEKIVPLAMMLGRNNGGMIVKIKTAGVEGLLASFKNTWNELQPKRGRSLTILWMTVLQPYIKAKNALVKYFLYLPSSPSSLHRWVCLAYLLLQLHCEQKKLV